MFPDKQKELIGPLLICLIDKIEEWDEKIQILEFAYNNSKNLTTGMAFYLNYRLK